MSPHNVHLQPMHPHNMPILTADSKSVCLFERIDDPTSELGFSSNFIDVIKFHCKNWQKKTFNKFTYTYNNAKQIVYIYVSVTEETLLHVSFLFFFFFFFKQIQWERGMGRDHQIKNTKDGWAIQQKYLSPPPFLYVVSFNKFLSSLREKLPFSSRVFVRSSALL